MRKTIFVCALFGCALFSSTISAQWTSTNGLPGGSTSQLINYGDTVLATIGAALYYSVNHGKAWSLIEHPEYDNIRVTSVEGNNALGYAYEKATGNFTWFRTDDFFQTMHPVLAGPNGSGLYKPLLAHGYIYTGAFPGLYRSENDGLSWEWVSSISAFQFVFDGTRLSANAYNRILQSVDGGFTWDTLLSNTGNFYGLFQYDNFFLAVNSSSNPGYYVSIDYGQTWQYYANNSLYGYYQFAGHQGTVFGMDGDRMVKSTDFGQTWTSVSFPDNLAYPANYGVSSGNAFIIGGNQTIGSAGLHRSIDNGNTWTPVSFGVVASSGKFRANNHDLFVSSPGGLFKNGSGGQQWTKLPLNLVQPPHTPWQVTDLVFVNGARVLSDYHNPWYSTDQGITWTKSMLPVLPGWEKQNITYFETVRDKIFGWGFDSHFNQYYTSADKGMSFQPLWVVYDNQEFRPKAMDIDQSKVYVYGQNNDIYRSDDAGLHWVLQSSVHPIDTIATWNPYEVNLLVSGQVMALSSSGPTTTMLVTFDGGQTWTNYSSPAVNLPWGNSLFNDLTQVGAQIVAATPKGVYFTDDNGANWEDWNLGLPSRHIAYLQPFGGYLWAAVSGGGIWKRPILQMGWLPATEDRFQALEQGVHDAAFQLVPNPAKAYTWVETGGQAGELLLVDMLGRSVWREALDGSRRQISLAGLPEGLYEVIFRSSNHTHHRPLLVQH